MANSQCPLCKTEQFESNLKRVILLEEIVASYTALRPRLLQLLAKNGEDVSDSNGSKRALSAEVIELLLDSESDVAAPKRQKTASSDDVTCPVCQETMAAEYLQNTHIDECLSGKKRASPDVRAPKTKSRGISSFFQNRQAAKPKVDHQNFYFNETAKHHHEDSRKLPKLDFSSLATPKLKEKLAAIKVPTTGTRHQLELRYNQYYILHNANLDSSHPVPGKVLQQRLSQWEAGHLAFSSTSTSLFGSRGSVSNKSITDNDFLVAVWMDTYKEEFRDLVKAARKSLKGNKNDGTTNDSIVGDESKVPDVKVGEKEAHVGDKEETASPEKPPLQNPGTMGTNAESGNSETTGDQPEFDFSASTLFTPAQ